MKNPIVKKLTMIFCALFLTGILYAQTVTVKGKITDAADGLPVIGASVVEKGTTNGTLTDAEGAFSLTVRADGILVISYVGYVTQEVPVNNQTTINAALTLDVVQLGEVVTIGYGTVRKSDATGSVAVVSAEDFNRGAVTAPSELITGKFAGVQITSNSGAPGAGSTIRIRGGSSLSADNDPLLVIDGVPVDNQGITGMQSSGLTFNPNDIESFTILKDASATAIYGSRASNGVIIITTKKGRSGSPLKVGYDGYLSLSMKTKKVDVLSADEFRDMIQKRYAGENDVLDLMGDANTDWQEEIFRPAIAHDHNLSLSGSVSSLPYRVSIGYTNQDGILLVDNMERITGTVNLNPVLLDNHLKIDFSAKAMHLANVFADWGAIGEATSFDPTQPVRDPESDYGGYYTWTQPNGLPMSLAPTNPVAHLKMTDNTSKVNRIIGNIQFDYGLHFLPDLHAVLNMGLDRSDSDGKYYSPENYAPDYDPVNGGGVKSKSSQDKSNELLDFYLNYKKDLTSISSRIDATAGYSWQHFWRAGTDYSTNVRGSKINTDTDYESENYLVSFFGRLNYVLLDRYLLTLTLRNDGSSRFSKETRWGLFPSFAFAWDVAKENFLNTGVFNTLKLRLGYGVTGQQNISNNDYPYMPLYVFSEPSVQYQFGNKFYNTLRPGGYDANIKWEETATYNIGLDYGFLGNRITGTIDAYYRETTDLINTIPVAAGTNLTDLILTNVGDLTNTGVEFAINAKAISTSNFLWEINFNTTYNKNEIVKLTAVDDPSYRGVQTGGISGGVGNYIQMHSVGHPASSFYVLKQVYNEDGDPLENLYADMNHDGEYTQDDDSYYYKKAAPDVYMGLSSYLRYRNFDLSLTARANLGNYVYNNVFAGSAYAYVYNSAGFLTNINSNLLETGFNNVQYWSDYFIENGSFLRFDNMTLGYNMQNLADVISSMRLYLTVQNLFLITKYRGLDPEVFNGIDSNIYPRPRNFLLGLSVAF